MTSVPVCIAWTASHAESLYFLTFDGDGGAGSVRVYPRDQYDWRLNLGRGDKGPLPFFDEPVTALAWMNENPGKRCQVALAAARRLASGLKFREAW